MLPPKQSWIQVQDHDFVKKRRHPFPIVLPLNHFAYWALVLNPAGEWNVIWTEGENGWENPFQRGDSKSAVQTIKKTHLKNSCRANVLKNIITVARILDKMSFPFLSKQYTTSYKKLNSRNFIQPSRMNFQR